MTKSFCDNVCDTFLFVLVCFGKQKISLEAFCDYLDALSCHDEFEIFNSANVIDIVNSIKKSKYFRSFNEKDGTIVIDYDKVKSITESVFDKYAKESCFVYFCRYLNCDDLAKKYHNKGVDFCYVEDETNGVFDMGSCREMDGSKFDTLIFTDGNVERIDDSTTDDVLVKLEDPDFRVRITGSTFTCYCNAVNSRITNIRFTDRFFNADFIDCVLDRLSVGDFCGYKECEGIPHVFRLRRH